MCCGRSLLCRGWHAAQLHRSCVQPTWVTVMFLPFLKLCTLCSWKITVSKKNEGQEEAGQETWTENCPFSQASSTPKLLWQQLPDKNLWPDPQEKKKKREQKTTKKQTNNIFPKLCILCTKSLGQEGSCLLETKGAVFGNDVTRTGCSRCCHSGTKWPSPCDSSCSRRALLSAFHRWQPVRFLQQTLPIQSRCLEQDQHQKDQV